MIVTRVVNDNGNGYEITPMPKEIAKRVALCRVEGTTRHPIAYFYKEEEAQRFAEFLAWLVNGQWPEEKEVNR